MHSLQNKKSFDIIKKEINNKNNFNNSQIDNNKPKKVNILETKDFLDQHEEKNKETLYEILKNYKKKSSDGKLIEN